MANTSKTCFFAAMDSRLYGTVWNPCHSLFAAVGGRNTKPAGTQRSAGAKEAAQPASATVRVKAGQFF
jgi:hypothetical protein